MWQPISGYQSVGTRALFANDQTGRVFYGVGILHNGELIFWDLEEELSCEVSHFMDIPPVPGLDVEPEQHAKVSK